MFLPANANTADLQNSVVIGLMATLQKTLDKGLTAVNISVKFTNFIFLSIKTSIRGAINDFTNGLGRYFINATGANK